MKLSRILDKVTDTLSSFLDPLIAIFFLLGIVGCAAILLIALSGPNKPQLRTTNDYAHTSVRITNMAETSGGTGVILASGPSSSTILTNAHVCRLIKIGGLVHKGNTRMLVKEFKVYAYHDLCMIKVAKDLGYNATLAPQAPATYSEALISGHPALLPHVLSKGNFSDDMVITVLVGARKCEKDDTSTYCAIFGVEPIIVSYNTTLVTGLIMPGSSGSAVFNAKGELSALIFAGSQGLSYGFVVPYEYVRDFVLREANNTEGWTTPNPALAEKNELDEETARYNIVVGVNNRWILSEEQIKAVLSNNFRKAN